MCPLPPLFLGVTKTVGEVEVNVSNIEPEESVTTGVMWKSFGRKAVPVFEEHLARMEKGISVDTWLQMTGLERAFIIAMRRTQKAVENQQAEAETRKAKRDSKRK